MLSEQMQISAIMSGAVCVCYRMSHKNLKDCIKNQYELIREINIERYNELKENNSMYEDKSLIKTNYDQEIQNDVMEIENFMKTLDTEQIKKWKECCDDVSLKTQLKRMLGHNKW